MKIDFSFICDYAEVTNKINALGIGFDIIYASSIPARHTSFFLVFQVRANVVEVGEKKFSVSLIDEDGNEIIPKINGKLTIPKPIEGVESKARIAVQFGMVKFPKHGSYSVHVVIEGQEMFSIPLKVIPPPKSV